MLLVASPLLPLIFFLVFSLFSFISMCLGVFLLGFILRDRKKKKAARMGQ